METKKPPQDGDEQPLLIKEAIQRGIRRRKRVDALKKQRERRRKRTS